MPDHFSVLDGDWARAARPVVPIIVSRPRAYFGDNPNCF
jgi:hypothetical protein